MLGRSSQRCGAALGVAGPDNKALVSKEMICIFSPMGPKPESPPGSVGLRPSPLLPAALVPNGGSSAPCPTPEASISPGS